MANFQPGAEHTLVIRPVVKQVKFISGGACFSAGAFDGSSVLILDFSFEDANSGTVLYSAIQGSPEPQALTLTPLALTLTEC